MIQSAHGLMNIVGLIHDAALEPPLWRNVLLCLMRRLGGIAGGMWLNDPVAATAVPIAHTGLDPSYTDRYSQHYLHVDPVFRIKSGLPVGGIVSTSMLMRHDAFVRTEFYNDWFRPQGFHEAIGAPVHRQAARFTWLSIVRPKGKAAPAPGDMAVLAGLVPHIVRALNVTQRLDMLADRQHALRDALAAAVHAVVLVDRQCRLVFANAAGEALLGPRQPLTVRQGRLKARDLAVDAALQAALARVLPQARGHEHGVVELSVPRRGRRPLLLSVLSGCARGGDHRDLDQRVAAMIIAADPEVRPWSRLEGVIATYGLTPAEGRVLDAVLDGGGLDRAADRLGIGRATVKTHLNRILAKTGAARQNELVQLVAAMVPPLRR
ncbi:helix-turn-helix transcriptional regulator [Vineibacter terrae]|uniref:helix-turn-helix transcriptional regulator n=1 Tax=Vineibacter terrae TaxID=2586908 RepID=UPI002E329808|nr:helix-turn-helix transcriptional regulator [Vineibacter terrae]HEX2886206.1 helix-turn-helix transcriptional regulator [Vineibacter terrae]